MLCPWPHESTLLLALSGCKSCASPVVPVGREPLGMPAGCLAADLQLQLTGACPSSHNSPSSQLMSVHPSWFAKRVSVVFNPSCWRLILAFVEREP